MNKNLILLLTFLTFFSSAGLVLAQIFLPNPLSPVNDFAALILNITDYITGFIGALAVLMFIWAGILYLTSGMNPSNVQKANKALLYAVIGLAIAMAGSGLITLIRKIISG